MTSNAFLIASYGCVAIGSFFILLSVGRLAWCEAIASDWRGLGRNSYFLICLALQLQSLALLGIGALRVTDGLHGVDIGGLWPMVLCVLIAALFVAKVAFHYAATITGPKWQWRLFLLAVFLWLVTLIWLF